MLITALSLIGVLAVGGLATVLILQSRLDSNVERIADPFDGLPSRPPATERDEREDQPMTLLVLGSDSRISAGDPSQWEAGGQRTDTIMLIHLPAERDAAYVMSIPRDSWVEIPGHGTHKINAAFSLGGPALTVQTIEQLTGVRVDHFAMTDFESFTEVTDELGGVLITLRQDLRVGDRTLAAGEQHLMNGEEALTYVRQRMNLARGDFDRVQRQQAWFRAIFARMRNEQTLQNPTKSYPFLDSVTRSVAFDEAFDRDVMNDLVDRARNLGSVDISFFTVPIQGTGRSADGQSIVVLDEEPFDRLMAAVREDAVGEYLQEHPDDVDILPPVAP
ncbi:transcriptional regulator [Cellulomonas bogoriensis 69B4 = DSM 16987]|uniref:Transcriptional regulator n=1 Tax=Cellulomonas bogoriensis 69B4 = DSM 16987 TaxID=1386082 RepID=A0A0A0BQ69_9CELL|nr:transcriptional regulator [Cellulomonas bogoriensis 69B4 = DSM 16987]